MSKFGQYNIILKEIKEGSKSFEFELNDEYFAKIDSPEVRKGSLLAKVVVLKKNDTFEIRFIIEGSVKVPCNRCLDDMEQPIKHDEKIQVKYGTTFSQEDDIVVVPETEGSINVAWFMYEFIALDIPIKHIHAPGECNKNMVSKLKRHITRQKDDNEDNPLFEFDDEEDMSTEDTQIDPRWENLQNINFDNN